MPLVPAPFLFRYSFPITRLERYPKAKEGSLDLPETCRIPWPSAIGASQPQFAELWLGWTMQGLAVNVRVSGKQQPVSGHIDTAGVGDRVWLWIDTRNTQGAHRASRFSHMFLVAPNGGGKDKSAPLIAQLPIPRAREDSPREAVREVKCESRLTKDGYRLNLWFPQETLHGFDPESQRRLGFYIAVQDVELGLQPLVVGMEFPFDADPSQWVTLELRYQ